VRQPGCENLLVFLALAALKLLLFALFSLSFALPLSNLSFQSFGCLFLCVPLSARLILRFWRH
jgi:hypothetical protein